MIDLTQLVSSNSQFFLLINIILNILLWVSIETRLYKSFILAS